MLAVKDLDVRTVEQLAQKPPFEFALLSEQYPDAYAKAFPGMSQTEAFAEALRTGHRTYIGEACWHCHSQQVRPWGNDEARYGRKSFPEEYHNELNMPPLWGTRRIGPDLIRRGGRQSNDWHVAHFYNPPDVNPGSVMPAYPWFYEADGLTPNKKGLSIITYVQWLGSWLPRGDETLYDLEALAADYRAPVLPAVPGAEVEQTDDGGEDDFWGEE
ncbi:MAG: cytochrome-c oxidase [Acidobacteria bacterium]|nr:cytochrome-c oxidase [Acidobacteriota bacterium]NIM60133.1 cytochrome-c oxidase [Acidobacteriota bacterium]NIO57802.1 cytochrome-c oxidase [Acidobacteriota bacterium]NIQ28811.1 cytochrome-c oxidase [Acidobacteriota bacterium]NIQ83269.1 cytochrome-c oxidase [Acidobacteriota bacterium]